MVSTDAPTYDVSIIRLLHADENPKGPGFKTQVMESATNRQYHGRKQVTFPGSYVLVEHQPLLADLTSFTLQAWIYPTTLTKSVPQGIITKWSNDAGYGLYFGENGDLGLSLDEQRVHTGVPLRRNEWYFVAASYDASVGEAHLYQFPVLDFPNDPSAVTVIEVARPPVASDAPLLIAAAYAETVTPGRFASKGNFNGKIDRPRVFARVLLPKEMEQLRHGAAPQDALASWDFAADLSSTKATDTGTNRLHGVVVNMPARGVTGHNWIGGEVDFRQAPSQYGAIHFHEDDLDDARWEVDFEFTVPSDWKSGVYAARLTAGDQEDEIPFFVRPHKGKPGAQALYLLPTMTYLAYANYRHKDLSRDETGTLREPQWQPLDQYLQEHPELAMSIYDFHSDGSGCHYSSRLRPIINMRPKFSWGLVGGPRHFAADLYLVDWLETKGFGYDVVTDEDFHFDGLELLANYKVVITGTHPEYWTTPMMDALEQYLAGGGRLMYLGGNGFYWVTSVCPERPHVVEVRRGIAGTRAWESPPGEGYHSTTGEPGGLWRYRGRAPNRIGGIGFTAQGWDGRAPGYTRQPGSFDPRAAFIFEGVGKEEIIGNFGLGLGGAAGDELDRVDNRLGTPYHTLVLASSSGHADTVLPVIEDYNSMDIKFISRENWQVRADMVYFETPNNGAVFSTGSIAWCSSLSHHQYNNNVSRVTENVLRRFLE